MSASYILLSVIVVLLIVFLYISWVYVSNELDRKSKSKSKRRDFLYSVSYALGAVGIGSVVWPLIDQMNPDASVKALATTEVDISNVESGKSITVLWRGTSIYQKKNSGRNY